MAILIQYNQERSFKIKSLEQNLSAYNTVIYKYLNSPDHSFKDLPGILPESLRVTIISDNGEVVYDNNKEGIVPSENHLDRPEVRSAKLYGEGSSSRRSETTQQEYIYQASYDGKFYIRVAQPYDVDVKNLLKVDNLYIYFILAIFIVSTLFLILISNKMGRSISALRDFALSLSDDSLEKSISFPDGELGDIGAKLVENYKSLKESENELRKEKDKLILHFTHSTVGIAFFSPAREVIYHNALFISHINAIADNYTLNIEDVFTIKEFSDTLSDSNISQKGTYEETINKNGQCFSLRLIIFEDHSIEVILNNITKQEKTRILKQQMSSNIAHELRTPVSSVSAYLETLINQKNMPEAKREQFIERSYNQIQRLSGLIHDISLISHIEADGRKIEKSHTNINDIVTEVIQDLENKTNTLNASIINDIKENICIDGNANLLYAIFRNLIENSENHVGKGVIIKASMFMEDKTHFYFSISDNGPGVKAELLPKIFDRFYRIDEGRTRTNGGSGLGLSIVKNAVLFHNGIISAKQAIGGGLEIIFSLAKSDI